MHVPGQEQQIPLLSAHGEATLDSGEKQLILLGGQPKRTRKKGIIATFWGTPLMA